MTQAMVQDIFNKAVVSVLLVYFMVMYTLSWVTGKSLDWNQLITFIVPGIIQIAALLGQTRLSVTLAKNGVIK